MRYVIYARKSSESEERQILSIEAQLAELQEYSAKEKLEIVASFQEALTAKEPENKSARTIFGKGKRNFFIRFMSQKGLVNIAIIIGIIILVGVAGYFVLNRQSRLTPTPTPAPTPGAPVSGPITVGGEITCLPKTGQGAQTLECAIGLRGTDGRHYGLKNLFKLDPEYKFSVAGLRVEISGSFSPEEMKGPGGSKYDVVGTIDVVSIKKVEGGAESRTGTVQPEDPNKAGLAPYPDLPLTSLPQQPLSIKSVVEHRSALTGKTVSIRGVIISTLLGEKACPPDRGMCAQPSIFLADTTDKNRNTLYDLRVLVGEEEQEISYPIGKTIDLQVVVDGSKVAVVARKTY